MQVESLAEQLFFTTVRIETENSSGRGSGTGFIYSYEWDAKTALFIVTNKHVVKDARIGHFFSL
jgi:S1-C subfamily serine protease